MARNGTCKCAPVHSAWRATRFSLLRAVSDPVAQDRLPDIVLQACLAREQEMAEGTTRK
jgi:hypothetical protein